MQPRRDVGGVTARDCPLSYTSQAAAPLSLPVASGQRQVSKINPYAGVRALLMAVTPSYGCPHGLPVYQCPQTYHPPQSFASYDYMPSEYDRERIISKFERLKHKLAQVTPEEFIVKAPPPAPKGAPAFSEFHYDLTPPAEVSVTLITTTCIHALHIHTSCSTSRSTFSVQWLGILASLCLCLMQDDKADEVSGGAKPPQKLSGPFLAGGKFDVGKNLRGLADHCMLSLCKQLSSDWPTAFLQVKTECLNRSDCRRTPASHICRLSRPRSPVASVCHIRLLPHPLAASPRHPPPHCSPIPPSSQVFEDSSGAVVMCFDKERAVTEGDMSSYMQHFQKGSRIVAEYKLVKDGSQWGLVDTETGSVFFVLWPPWVRHRYLGVSRQQLGRTAVEEEGDLLAADSAAAI